MKFISKKSLLVSLLAVVPFVASAQLSSNISLTSNYKFRGQDQDLLNAKNTDFKPALQGGFDYAFSNGFYVGNWNSSVNWLPGNSLEVDVYGGYKGEMSPGLTYDVGAVAYMYPGNSLGKTTEVYLGMGYGPFSAKYSQSVSNDYFYYGSKASYFNVGYATEVTKGLTFKAAAGMTNFKDSSKVDFSDYSVGLSYDLGEGFSLGGAYVGATKKSDYVGANDGRVVLTLSKAM